VWLALRRYSRAFGHRDRVLDLRYSVFEEEGFKQAYSA
jgi:hypothetical protein